jgi:epoxyqueuosine reductase
VSPEAEGRPIECLPTAAALSARVKATGLRLGFDRVAIGPAAPPEHGAAFEAWLDAGHAGAMAYLERSRARRLDPGLVLPGARSVITGALNYFQGDPDGETVARYARGGDYHDVITPMLEALLADLEAARPGTAGRVYVDTGPVLERDLAARAGLGWVGKNTMLLHPELGSWFFIGVVLTTADLAHDAPMADRCGTCTRCLDACPTAAFVAPYVLDARRCVSYLTIEQRGPIPAGLRAGLGGRAFGCDACQDVCPWNRRAPTTSVAAFRGEAGPSLLELLALDQDAYRARLRGSPLRRAGRDGLARSAAVGLGNGAGDPAGAVPALVAALGDGRPVVRGHAAWALGRLGGPAARAALASAAADEADPAVLDEIRAALGEAAETRVLP